jgi:hypothetical protein
MLSPIEFLTDSFTESRCKLRGIKQSSELILKSFLTISVKILEESGKKFNVNMTESLRNLVVNLDRILEFRDYTLLSEI